MGSTGATPLLALSQFMPDDKPSWQGDYNADMRKIEASMAGEANLNANMRVNFIGNGGQGYLEANPTGNNFAMGNGWFNFMAAGKDALSNTGSLYAYEMIARKTGSSSSRTIKKNIETITSEQAEKVLALRPVSFDYKSNGEPSVGFIAQEMEEYFPELVSQRDKEDPDTYSINYAALVAPIVALCQKMQREIDELKAEKK